MIRTHYFTAEEAERLLMKAFIEELVKEGWEREGIIITKVDPFKNGVNGYQCEQGTVGAMLTDAQVGKI